MLLNVGPTPEGVIEPCQVERLKEIGAWLAKYGQSIYGTRGGPYKPKKDFASTRKGKDNLYPHHGNGRKRRSSCRRYRSRS